MLTSLTSAYTHAISHLENLDQTSVAATADAEALRARVGPLPVEGLPADEVVQELVRNVDGGLIGSAGGRFFGWVIGGVLPAALAADWLTSAWQQNGALYATSPASAIVEARNQEVEPGEEGEAAAAEPASDAAVETAETEESSEGSAPESETPIVAEAETVA